MKRKIIFITVFAISTISAIIGYTFRPSPNSMKNSSTAYSISSEQLATSFETDEEKANTTYLNKVIVIEGKLSEIENAELDKAILSVKGNSTTNISCLFSNTELPTPKPEIGQIIKIKGICTGYIFDVVLTKCSVIN